jgi:hypothetical protein
MSAPLLERDIVADLEAMFAIELPCGGNIYPEKRPCPDNAPATMILRCPCDPGPEDFKCFECYSRWLRAHIDKGTMSLSCEACGDTPIHECYRAL